MVSVPAGEPGSGGMRVCVTVPVFRLPLTSAEQAALARCVAVLHAHPIILFTPERLDVAALLEHYPHLRQERFADAHFRNANSYNQLMLSDAFYARFAAYDYILVHQLDAFVFSDQLIAWCERGYDYIGAPWIWGPRRPNAPYRLYSGLMRTACRWLARPRPDDRPLDRFFRRQLSLAAGNGGFSLRRVATMRDVLARLDRRAELYRSARPHPATGRPTGRWGEDVFFAVEANRYRRHVRTPSLPVAARFAWEMNPAVAARLTGGTLPFGCHAWDRLFRDQWRPIFAQIGYSLDELLVE